MCFLQWHRFLGKDAFMSRMPRVVRELLEERSSEFHPTVWSRFFAMLLVVMLLRDRRTVLRLHDLAARLSPGHFSTFHRVFSHRRWRTVELARTLAIAIVNVLSPEGTLEIVGDDTVSQHRGAGVYGKACHRVGMLSGRRMATWSIVGGISGWCWRYESAFLERVGVGLFLSWSLCIERPN